MVDERYTVTKELGQGAYGIVWYGFSRQARLSVDLFRTGLMIRQRGAEQPNRRWGCYQEGHECF